MDKVKVVISKKGTTTELFKASVDEDEIEFDNNEATLYLTKREKEYALSWFARGKPSSRYSITITEPENAKFSHTAILDNSKKDAGVQWFKI